jgi:hypothetical protein
LICALWRVPGVWKRFAFPHALGQLLAALGVAHTPHSAGDDERFLFEEREREKEGVSFCGGATRGAR